MQLTKQQMAEYCTKTLYQIDLNTNITNKQVGLTKSVNSLMTYDKEYIKNLYKLALKIQHNRSINNVN